MLATTHELLAKSGLSGVSIHEVSRRYGVAKTTIYRHWPSRVALLMDACSQLSSWPPVPDSGKLGTDLETLAVGAAMRLQQPWSTVMPSIIDAAERGPRATAVANSRTNAGAFLTAIERAQQRGELPRSQDARELVASIFGPILYRRFFSREPTL